MTSKRCLLAEEQTCAKTKSYLDEKATTIYSGTNPRIAKATSVERQISRVNSERVRINLALLGERKSTHDPVMTTNAITDSKGKLEVTKEKSNPPSKQDPGNAGDSKCN